LGQAMMDRLRSELAACEQVGEVRGRGFMQGIEFVEDRRTKAYNPGLRDRIVRNCVFKQKLWVLGSGRSTIRLLPALVTSEDEAMEAVDRFVRAVREETRAVEAAAKVAASTP
jgi:4-aminobutyrate aminotransferase-like enzyme